MPYSKFHEATTFVMLCLIMTVAIPNLEVIAATNVSRKAIRKFVLSVQFGPLSNKKRVEIITEISPNTLFSGRVTDEKGHRYAIGGLLLPHKKGKYRIVLTALNWDELSGDENFGSLVPELEPGQTVTVCDSDGIIHNCISIALKRL